MVEDLTDYVLDNQAAYLQHRPYYTQQYLSKANHFHYWARGGEMGTIHGQPWNDHQIYLGALHLFLFNLLSLRAGGSSPNV